jgi:hypothetical protein
VEPTDTHLYAMMEPTNIITGTDNKLQTEKGGNIITSKGFKVAFVVFYSICNEYECIHVT